MIVDYVSVLMTAPPSHDFGAAPYERGIEIVAASIHTPLSDMVKALGAPVQTGRSQRMRGGLYVRYEQGAQTDTKAQAISAYLTLSGVPCQTFRDHNLLDPVLKYAKKATRFDVAYDYPYMAVSAEHITSLFSNDLVTARSTDRTDTGDTYYFGSITAEKQLAVYQFKHPHPRAYFTRVEMRYRGESATQALQQYNVVGLKALTKTGFMWAGLPIPTDVDLFDAATIRSKPRSTGAKTEIWIKKQVVPAVHRLKAEGVITDLRAWLWEVFGDGS